MDDVDVRIHGLNKLALMEGNKELIRKVAHISRVGEFGQSGEVFTELETTFDNVDHLAGHYFDKIKIIIGGFAITYAEVRPPVRITPGMGSITIQQKMF